MSIEEVLKVSMEKNEMKKDIFKSNSNVVKLGVMGGTFNPIHNAHIAICEYIKSCLNLDKIVFMPSGDPPHKNNTLSKIHRYNMVILSTYENEDFIVSDYEVSQENKKTYTVDTLKYIKNTYPNAEIYFITGSDAINDMESWKDFRENFKGANFVVALRPGIDQDMTIDNVNKYREKYGANIEVVYVPQMDISSTDIRAMSQESRNIKKLVPSNVWEYINELSLYGGANR